MKFGIFSYRDTSYAWEKQEIDAIGAQWEEKTFWPLLEDSVSLWKRMDAFVTVAESTGMEPLITLSTSLDAEKYRTTWPPTADTIPGPAADSGWVPTWRDRVGRIAARYNHDGHNDAPGLLAPVIYWHIEEEGSFWRPAFSSAYADTTRYVDELVATRAAILDSLPSAKIVLIGLDSDMTWSRTYDADTTHVPKPPTGVYVDTLSRRLHFESQARWWLHQASLYDIADMHSYEQQPVIQAKVRWVKNLMPDTTKEIWCVEGGGPSFADSNYTDVRNADFVYKSIGEALANGVARYAWMYLPQGSPRYANVCLMDAQAQQNPMTEIKQSFMTYSAMSYAMRFATLGTDWRLAYRNRAGHSDVLYVETFGYSYVDPLEPVVQAAIVWAPESTVTDSTRMWIRLRANTGRGVPFLEITDISSERSAWPPDTLREFSGTVMEDVPISQHPRLIRCNYPFDIFPYRNETGIGDLEGGDVLALRPSQTPFRGKAKLWWSVPRAYAGEVAHIVIANALGQCVRRITVTTSKAARGGWVTWDLTTTGGQRIPNGLYFAALEAQGKLRTTCRFAVLR